jgi:hypothetical protein
MLLTRVQMGCGHDRPAAAAAAGPDQRLDALDVVRGLLMVLITCSHARLQLVAGHERFCVALSYLLTGTVGFASLSGTLVGWFAATRGDRYPAVAARYRTQAFRLLLCHPLICLALAPSARIGLWAFTTRTVYVTDVLALIFVVVVPWVPRLRPRARIVVGIALLLGTPVVAQLPNAGAGVDLLRELACGVDPMRHHALISNYGVLPLAGMFMVGTWLGDVVARAGRSPGGVAGLAPWLRRRAVALVIGGGTLVTAWGLAHVLYAPSSLQRRLLFPTYEGTLYPIYLAELLLLLGLALHARPPGWVTNRLAGLGRASLFAYLLQYVIVETVPHQLGWERRLPPLAFAAFVVASLAVLIAATDVWRRGTRPARPARPLVVVAPTG